MAAGRRHKEKYTQIGLNIAYYRKKKGYTQEQLAELVDISRTHLSSIEATRMERAPSLDVMFDIAEMLDVDVAKLFENK